MKRIFNESLDHWGNQENLFFNPQIKYKEVFLEPRLKYSTEVLRQLACSFKRVVAIVDSDHVDFFEEHWQNLPREVSPLSELLKIPEIWNAPKDTSPNAFLNQDSFLEFVEKQVMLELLQDLFIDKYFISKKSFPFSHEGFLGHETAVLNVLTFWHHYKEKYRKEMQKKGVISAEKMEQWEKEMGYDHLKDDEPDISEQN